MDITEIFKDFKGPSQRFLAQYVLFSSNKVDTYTVSVCRHTGKYECSCPHYIYRLRRTNGRCKHILLVQEFEAETLAFRMDV